MRLDPAKLLARFQTGGMVMRLRIPEPPAFASGGMALAAAGASQAFHVGNITIAVHNQANGRDIVDQVVRRLQELSRGR
jgi:hypothetical protein